MTDELTVKTQIAKIELPDGGFKLENGQTLPELEIALTNSCFSDIQYFVL